MKIMCWGGRSKARIMLRMLDEQYNSNHFITGLFDRTLDSLPFKTKEKLEISPEGVDSARLTKWRAACYTLLGHNHSSMYYIFWRM